PPARGRRPDVRGARGEHRLVRGHGRGSAREELVHGGGRGREVAAHAADGVAERRGRLRRVPGHAVVGQVPELVLRAEALAAEMEFGRSSIREVGRLLGALAASRPGGRLAEIGTGTGVGAAWVASMMGPDASFVTVEVDGERAAACAELFAGVPNLRVLHGDW